MRAVRLSAYGEPPEVVVREVPVPVPGPGQVLVRVEASPLHPVDRRFCAGDYGFRRAIPTTPGFEGVGEVVATGGGAMTRLLSGRRVAFGVQAEGEGLWAEYAVADAARCIPLWKGIALDEAASLLVRPLTALALVDEVERLGSPAFVHTCGASRLGRYLTAWGRHRGLGVVAVSVGGSVGAHAAASVVLDPQAEDFPARLRRACHAVQPGVLLDGLGGELTGRVLQAMPEGSTAILYGAAAGAGVEVGAAELVYRRKTVRGFWLSDWAAALGVRAQVGLPGRLRRLVQLVPPARPAQRMSLDEVPGELEAPTEGTKLVLPGPGDDSKG